MRKCWPAAAALCGTVPESCHAGSSSQPTRPLPLLPLYLPAPSMQGLCILFCIPTGSGSEGKSVWVPRPAARAARCLVAQVGVQKHCLLSHWYGVNAHVNTTPGGIPTAVCGHWELFADVCWAPQQGQGQRLVFTKGSPLVLSSSPLEVTTSPTKAKVKVKADNAGWQPRLCPGKKWRLTTPSAETLNHLLTLCSYRNRCTPLLEAHLWGKVHASGRALLLSLGLQPSSQAQLSAWDSLRNTSARGLKVTQFPNNA